MQRGQASLSAVDEVRNAYGMEVVGISTLDDLVAFLAGHGELAQQLRSVRDYRQKYGVPR